MPLVRVHHGFFDFGERKAHAEVQGVRDVENTADRDVVRGVKVRERGVREARRRGQVFLCQPVPAEGEREEAHHLGAVVVVREADEVVHVHGDDACCFLAAAGEQQVKLVSGKFRDAVHIGEFGIIYVFTEPVPHTRDGPSDDFSHIDAVDTGGVHEVEQELHPSKAGLDGTIFG